MFEHQPAAFIAWPGRRRLALFVLLASTACRGADPGSEVLARYRGGTVTRADYDSWRLAKGGSDDPSRRLTDLRAIALNGALAQRVENDPEGLSEALRWQLEESARSVLAGALRTRVERQVTVDEAEIERQLAAFDQNRHQPRRVQLRNIFKRVPPNAGPAARRAARDRLQSIRRQLLDGADFDALARRESDSQTARRGGRMGIAEPGQLAPALDAVVQALEEGELSEVLEGPNGATLLWAERVIPARVMPEDEARDRLRRRQRRLQGKEAWQALQRTLLEQAAPRYDLRAAADPEAGDDAVVARFGERTIRRRAARLAVSKPPRSASLEGLGPERLRAALERQVVTALAAERARQEGLDAEPTVAARVLWQRRHLLAGEALRREIAATFSPPDEAALRAHFETHRRNLIQYARYRLMLIRLPFEDQAMAAAASEANALVAALRAGDERFEAAARRLSQHPSAARGGLLPWRSARQLAQLGPDVLDAAGKLSPGEIGEPVAQDGALWILRLLASEPARPLSFDEARPQIERHLGNQQTKALKAEIEARILAELDVQPTP